MRLVGDAKVTLEALTEALKNVEPQRSITSRDQLTKLIQQAREKHQLEVERTLNIKTSPLRIESIMKSLNEHLHDDHIIVSDASFSSIWTANYIDAVQDRKFIFPRGLAGLGWGLPMAMGAKLANNQKKIFCLTGDGGFAHVWSELETCNREGIKVVVAVINNTVLGYQKHSETVKWGNHTSACILNSVDYVKIAEACGIKGIKIDSYDKIDQSIQEALEHEGSVVLDLIIDPDCIPPLPFMSPLDNI